VPTMAIEEARLIRETMGSGQVATTPGAGAAGAAPAGASTPFAPAHNAPGGGAS
jgi:hypothetical protein